MTPEQAPANDDDEDMRELREAIVNALAALMDDTEKPGDSDA